MFVQVEFVPQGGVEFVHSFTSMQFLPSELAKPEAQVQVYEPTVLAQVELLPHGLPPAAVHSLMSAHVVGCFVASHV